MLLPRTLILTGTLLLSCAAVAAPSLGAPDARPALVASEALTPAPWAPALDAEVADVRRAYRGDLAAYVSDPYRGFYWGYNADAPMYLASVVKVAFMVEVFRQRDAGDLSLNDEITYEAVDIRDGAPRVNAHRVGARFTINLLLDWMMSASDNAASDLLARRVGLDRVNAGLAADGLDFGPITSLGDVRRGVFREVDVRADDLSSDEVRSVRWKPGWDAQAARLTELVGRPRGTYGKQDLFDAFERFYGTPANRAPMRSVGRLLEKLARGELVSEGASAEMIALMSRARTSENRLLGRLPRGTRAPHKTGSQHNRLCDVGLIYLPDGIPIVVAACTAEGGVRESELAIARVARKAYDLALAERKANATASREAR